MIRYNHLVLQERIKLISFHISANCCTIRQDLEQMIAILWVCKLTLWFKCSTVTNYNYRLLGSELEGETEKKKWKKFHCSLSPSKYVLSTALANDNGRNAQIVPIVQVVEIVKTEKLFILRSMDYSVLLTAFVVLLRFSWVPYVIN